LSWPVWVSGETSLLYRSFIYQLMHNWIVLKTILKFTLKLTLKQLHVLV
jgi:hypothetical protein